jgi:hypothetical protein
VSDQPSGPEKKIIVDEGWKAQVEAEREAARQQEPAPSPPPPPLDDDLLPPPSLTYLAGTLYLQGAIALGLLPNPVTGKAEVRLNRARHTIDTVQMLQEKTEGNRTADETPEFDTSLHQLRLAFVEVSAEVGKAK